VKKRILLISHTDLDGISPNILLTLTGEKFDAKNIDINDIDEAFKELIAIGFSKYSCIYICDLTPPDFAYDYFNKNKVNVKVFDHHVTHLFANAYPYVKVIIDYDGIQTCATEIFFNYLITIYPNLNKPNIKDYVRLVRELDTYNFTDNRPKDLDNLKSTYGTKDFIKSITRRLKKDKNEFEFSPFEKRFLTIETEKITRYLEKKDKTMLRYKIQGKKVGISFAESNKSELGNYLSLKYPELDLIILIDASSRISYRTSRDDVDVSTFASLYGGGGHVKASGSKFSDEDRDTAIRNYFKDAIKLENKKEETI